MNIDNPKWTKGFSRLDKKVEFDFNFDFHIFDISFSVLLIFLFGIKKNLLFRIELEIIRGALIRRNIREDEFFSFIYLLQLCQSFFVTVTFLIWCPKDCINDLFSIVENNK